MLPTTPDHLHDADVLKILSPVCVYGRSGLYRPCVHSGTFARRHVYRHAFQRQHDMVRSIRPAIMDTPEMGIRSSLVHSVFIDGVLSMARMVFRWRGMADGFIWPPTGVELRMVHLVFRATQSPWCINGCCGIAHRSRRDDSCVF